ncbi:sigma-54-dependent Fis family transcriptional regulator [Thalassoglobus polymorphus]|uniref:Transcriptional regulatory protein ZraR n=1 Tax=Thalassoglobus polymorphus TaxID=2527994 RepID=A0A517QLX2_9PLAN|nr:sigma-54 dependent transcriptional regulator [Thalassoglobus polymorphus]QDT32639.1 Transcriptional regulatory protein ZraR [Thalassoglobus polymorphus]
MKVSVSKIWLISFLAIFAVIYGLIVLWFVPTQPMVPIGCLIGTHDDLASGETGLLIRDNSALSDAAVVGSTPEVGDRVVELAGHPIYSFTDWIRAHRKLRKLEIGSGGTLEFGIDPTEDPNLGNLSAVEYPDHSRFVRVYFRRPGETEALVCFLPLIPQPASGVSMTLVWYVLQLFVVVIGGVAYWNRPFDQPVRTFFALSAVTLLAFVGGSHWWVISASPFLVIVFAVSGALLPAVLLHFLMVYPFPSPVYRQARVLTLFSVYALPICGAVSITVLTSVTWWLTQDQGVGPFAVTLERNASLLAAHLLPVLHVAIYSVLGLSVLYFAVCVQRLARSYQVARNPLEKNQVKWILWAALFAVLPIGYTFYLAIFDHVRFALGAARLPMFLASLAFMLAYGIGIARYKLMLIDQIVSRGVWYYGSSIALALVFSALISVGAVNALHQDLSIFGQTIPLILVFMTSILVLSWFRDTIQRTLDRNFFSEKYQLDKALQRMNRVVSDVLEPEAVSASLLDSCREVLQVDEAALYLRRKDLSEYRMLMSSGHTNFPIQFTMSSEATESLTEHRVLQRVPQGTSPSQQLIRTLKAEVIHGLEIQEQLGGILVLGAKPNHASYSAEDVAFVIAMARITAIALHCATVQQDVSRLNQDLQLKSEKILDQERMLSSLHNELAALSETPVPRTQEEPFVRSGILGKSLAMQQVLETVRKVASSSSSVLIRGESGTGKELLAKAVHENSARRTGPMVSVHCAALSSTLLESELFGHVKGAFTDAREDKIGRFQMANGGTLFLDEIGDISLEVQVKLLRVLQERTFEPVGSDQTVAVDVRLVAATHQNLEQLIAEGKFREDLFYRLNVISMTLPPLRERKDDIFDLALKFLKTSSEKANKQVFRIQDDAFNILQNYNWPGNIRELQNVIERAVVLADGNAVRLEDIPEELIHPQQIVPRSQAPQAANSPGSAQVSVARKTVLTKEDEEQRLRSALESCSGNKAEAARLLGMPRSTFFSKLKKFGI